MTGLRLELLLWSLAAGMLAGSAVAWHRAIPRSGSTAAVLPSAPPPLRFANADSPASAVDAVVQGDPFRLDRHPAGVPYRPEREGAPPAPPPAKPPRPSLAVAGVVGGPPWEALLEGLPGREGSVLVRDGDTLGGLTIRAVGRDTVIVQGADTTWRLTMKRPWQ